MLKILEAVARFGTANTPQDIPGSVEYGEVYINADENIGVVEPIEAIESRAFFPQTGIQYILATIKEDDDQPTEATVKI